jgi:two-component system chemotaxis response regulator CheB
VVVGGSAGSIEAANDLFGGLPADLAAAVFLVTHVPSESISVLPKIIGRASPLPARHAADGELSSPGGSTSLLLTATSSWSATGCG